MLLLLQLLLLLLLRLLLLRLLLLLLLLLLLRLPAVDTCVAINSFLQPQRVSGVWAAAAELLLQLRIHRSREVPKL